jgi:hypothetical protein
MMGRFAPIAVAALLVAGPAAVIQVDSAGNAVRLCTISAKRTSVSAPPIPPCVPLP